MNAEIDTARQVEVLLPKPFNHGFDYHVPGGMDAKPGSFVMVPFGRQELAGIVWGEGKQNVPKEKLKPIANVLGHLPPVSDRLRGFIDWVANYTLAPKGMVLKMIIPATEALEEPEVVPHYLTQGDIPKPVSPARSKIWDLLADGEARTALDIRKEAGVTAPVVKSLIDSGVLVEMVAPEKAASTLPSNSPKLSEAQVAATQELASVLEKGFSVSVLDGVTGSGKTEVYFDAIARVLEKSEKQVLVLLPEIALGVQWVTRCEKRFGFRPHIWHSGLTPRQRRENWRDIVSGKARLIVGARSALFLPYRDLALIVVDEEHEPSYKQEEGVIYHGRDMAVARGFHEKLPVVLVSATPSLETVQNVRDGKYREVKLPERHGGVSMPEVKPIDMRAETLDTGTWISPALKTAIAETLAAGKQAMLFLNRRGYAPLMLCRTCGHRLACEQCASWMVLHGRKGKPYLQCHHCGVTKPLPDACPSCATKDSLVACGPGVERVTEEVQEKFPQARVAVMTSDTMTSYKAAQDTVAAMTEGTIDILVGTQMMAKGYHFPALHLIGVVDADLGLAGGDLRAAERTYQLLHQVAGRAGREADRGLVILQTYMPDHPVMEALAHHDREGFEKLELEARQGAGYPPFGRLAAVIVEGAVETDVMAACRILARQLPKMDSIQVLGPAPAPLSRLRGRYRYRFLAKAPRNTALQRYIAGWLQSADISPKIKIRVDIDPYTFL